MYGNELFILSSLTKGKRSGMCSSIFLKIKNKKRKNQKDRNQSSLIWWFWIRLQATLAPIRDAHVCFDHFEPLCLGSCQTCLTCLKSPGKILGNSSVRIPPPFFWPFFHFSFSFSLIFHEASIRKNLWEIFISFFLKDKKETWYKNYKKL